MRSSSLKIEEDRGWKEDRMDCGGRALSSSSDSGGGFGGGFPQLMDYRDSYLSLGVVCFNSKERKSSLSLSCDYVLFPVSVCREMAKSLEILGREQKY